MPDKKLNLSHKLAGVIERLIKTTSIKDINLNTFKGIGSARFNIEPVIKREFPYIAANEKNTSCTITPGLIEIIAELKENNVSKVSLSELNTDVINDNLQIIHSVNRFDIITSINIKVEDYFKKYNISSKLKYKTKIKELNLNLFKPKVFNVGQLKYSRIIDNYYLIKKCTILKISAILTFLSEKEQLVYWRKAVIQTKRNPKDLELIGVYYKVPYYDIENFKIDFNKKVLSYKLKENFIAKNMKTCDIIIFRDILKKKGIIIEN